MKKVSISRLLILTCFLLVSSMLSAQGLIILYDDDGTGNSTCPHCPINQNGDKNAKLTLPHVQVANLIKPVDSWEIVNLPSDAEPMFLQLVAFGNTWLLPITDFRYEGEENGHNYFRSVYQTVVFPVGSICSSDYGLISSDISWKLVKSDETIYPIHDSFYRQPNGIFSCEVFEETCYHCHPDCNGSSALWPIKSSKRWIDCGSDPGGSEPSNPIYPGTEQYIKGAPTKASATTLSIRPNPFQDHLQIDYQVEVAGKVNLQIFNAQGQLMINRQSTEAKGIQRYDIDTQQWPNGVYYGKIQNGEYSQTVKVLKID